MSLRRLRGANKAKDLYVSPLFKKTYDYTNKIDKPEDIYILSALYGLIHNEEIVEPYDKTLLNMSKEESLEWAEKVKTQLVETLGEKGLTVSDCEFIIYAGSKYYKGLTDFLPNYKLPLDGMRIGERLKFLSEV